MTDILLLDAVERYLKGEMLEQEKKYFEEIRKNNADIDQLVVEHILFINQVNNYGNVKAFKHSLQEVEDNLTEEGVIAKNSLKGKAKVAYLWQRYKRNIAVAASIAAFFSLLTTALTLTYTNKTKQSELSQLKRDIIENTKKEIKNFSAKEDKAMPPAVLPAKYGGTGFLIDGTGFIVTNQHVIIGMKNLRVENNKGVYFNATPIYGNDTTDLAILKIEDTTFKTITLPYSIKKNTSELGESIFTLGYPKDEIVYGEGYLSAKSGFYGDTCSYQLTISVNPGNSGGPVINKLGEVVGIISSKEKNSDGVVFASKSKNIFNALRELKKDKAINIKLSSSSQLKGLDRVSQIKKIEDCIFMVKGN
jgi:serine protease Do